MTGIWVESQDFKTLLCAKEIRIEQSIDKLYVIVVNGYKMGEYDNYDKAMRVMNKIQHFLQTGYDRNGDVIFHMSDYTSAK